jgi:hypothetical protein
MAFTIDKIAFNIAGLLINIPSKKEVKIGQTVLDPIEWLWCLEHIFCHPLCTGIQCAPPHQPPVEIEKAFAALKKELLDQLGKNRARLKEIKEELRPQTVAQVDELRNKLHTALVELDSRRDELERAKDK